MSSIEVLSSIRTPPYVASYKGHRYGVDIAAASVEGAILKSHIEAHHIDVDKGAIAEFLIAHFHDLVVMVFVVVARLMFTSHSGASVTVTIGPYSEGLI